MIMISILILMSAAYIPTIGTSAQRAPRPTAVGAPAPQCHTTRIFSVNSKLQYFPMFSILPQCHTTHIACKASCNNGPSLMIQHSMSQNSSCIFHCTSSDNFPFYQKQHGLRFIGHQVTQGVMQSLHCNVL